MDNKNNNTITNPEFDDEVEFIVLSGSGSTEILYRKSDFIDTDLNPSASVTEFGSEEEEEEEDDDEDAFQPLLFLRTGETKDDSNIPKVESSCKMLEKSIAKTSLLKTSSSLINISKFYGEGEEEDEEDEGESEDEDEEQQEQEESSNHSIS